jgi:hypothetical protein
MHGNMHGTAAQKDMQKLVQVDLHKNWRWLWGEDQEEGTAPGSAYFMLFGDER